MVKPPLSKQVIYVLQCCIFLFSSIPCYMYESFAQNVSSPRTIFGRTLNELSQDLKNALERDRYKTNEHMLLVKENNKCNAPAFDVLCERRPR